MLDSSPPSRSACQGSLFLKSKSCLPTLVALRVRATVDSRRSQDKQPAQPESSQTLLSEIAKRTRVPKRLPTSDRPAQAREREATIAPDAAAGPDIQHSQHLAGHFSHGRADRRQLRDSSKRAFE